jgi:hypothetical protein
MQGLRKPPEGALVGEDVPVENDTVEIERGLIEELATYLGERPGYAQYDRARRVEIAKEKLREIQ